MPGATPMPDKRLVEGIAKANIKFGHPPIPLESVRIHLLFLIITAIFSMGFYYRKSVNFGPFRVNLSKSGVGGSVGVRGFRTGVSSKGRRHTTFSLPGTGIGYRKSSGCLVILAAIPASIFFTHWLFNSLL